MAVFFCPSCMEEINGTDKFCSRCGKSLSVRAESHHMPIGTVLKNDGSRRSYLFGRALGEGGFGITYIGRELVSGKKVAIKEYFPAMCNPSRLENGEVRPISQKVDVFDRGRDSFLSEASMLRALNDVSGIVHVMDFFRAKGTAYIVMEYLNGITLKDVVSGSGPMDYRRVLELFMPLMQSIVRIHEAGVIHRDIAPDNIMLMPDGTLKLLDFGCARSVEDGRSMTVALKPGFAPIEQYTRHDQNASTDLHALCATMYYCITGRVPLAATERSYAMLSGKADPMVPISSLGIDIPEYIDKAILKGSALQPTERTASVGEFLAELTPQQSTTFTPPPEMGNRTAADPAPAQTVRDPVVPPPPAPANSSGSQFWEKYKTPALIVLGIIATAALIALIFSRF